MNATLFKLFLVAVLSSFEARAELQETAPESDVIATKLVDIVVLEEEGSTLVPEETGNPTITEDLTMIPSAEVSTIAPSEELSVGSTDLGTLTETEYKYDTLASSTMGPTDGVTATGDFGTLPPPPPILVDPLQSNTPVTCGTNTCSEGEYCCNSSCSICAPIGSACIQAICEPCGPATCMAGDVCCNESCGICTAPRDSCSQATCDSRTGSHDGGLRFLRKRQ